MNSPILLLAAAAVVVAANLWVPLEARWNRAAPTGGTLPLSERELVLQERPGDSTVALLEVSWRAGTDPGGRRPEWLNQAKLAELGFDCRVPLATPEARQHYRRLGPRPVWLALTLLEPSSTNPPPARAASTRLTVVDAHRDAMALRRRFPDPTTHVVVPGIVRLTFHDGSKEAAAPREPEVRGWIGTLLPPMLFVPRPFSIPLLAAAPPPAFTATVAWGAQHIPWLTDLRPE